MIELDHNTTVDELSRPRVRKLYGSFTPRMAEKLKTAGFDTAGKIAYANWGDLLAVGLSKQAREFAQHLRKILMRWDMPIGTRLELDRWPTDWEPECDPVERARMGLMLSPTHITRLAAILDRDGSPEAREIHDAISDTVERARSMFVKDIDPSVEAVAWTEIPAGYQLRVACRNDFKGGAFVNVLRRWDAEIMGQQVSIIQQWPRRSSDRYRIYAWAEDPDRCRMLGETNGLDGAKAIAFYEIRKSFPAISPVSVNERTAVPSPQKKLKDAGFRRLN